MGKRSEFERLPQDRYLTPWKAVTYLRPFLPPQFTFCEPCAANGNLTRHLERIGGTPLAQYDLTPEAPGIRRMDARNLLSAHLNGADFLITNPPWDRPLLHAMILRWSRLGVTVWALWDANWAFTDQAQLLMDHRRGRNLIRKIVTVGRLIWIPGTTMAGKDDCAWFEIGAPSSEPADFYPRLDAG